MAYKSGKDRADGSRFFIGAVILGLIVTLAAGWFAAGRTASSITKSDIDNSLVSLNSYAAEAGYLSDQYDKQRPTANYTKVSALKLKFAVSELARQLQDEQSAPDVAGTVQKTINYADDLSRYLAKLSMLPDSGQAKDLNGRIHKLAQQINVLEESQ
jgi:hypothetical protein